MPYRIYTFYRDKVKLNRARHLLPAIGSVNLLVRSLKTRNSPLDVRNLDLLKANQLEAALKINKLNLGLFNLKLAYDWSEG